MISSILKSGIATGSLIGGNRMEEMSRGAVILLKERLPFLKKNINKKINKTVNILVYRAMSGNIEENIPTNTPNKITAIKYETVFCLILSMSKR